MMNTDTINKLESAIITLKYRDIPYILDDTQEKYQKENAQLQNFEKG